MPITLHPRTKLVTGAQSEINRHVLDTVLKYDLTYGELFSILSQTMAQQAKYCIRAERSLPEPGKGGDVE